MLSNTKFIVATALLFTSAFAQQSATPAASPSSAAAATGSAASAATTNVRDIENLVEYLIPSATSSLSPAQESRIAVDASNFLVEYTATKPLTQALVGAFIGQLFGGASTTPSPAQESSIDNLLGMAGTAALANPSAYVQSVEEIVRPFAFAAAVTSYADGLFDGLRTVIASELSVPVPTPTSQSSSAGASKPMATGVVGAAAAAALGVAGVAML